MHNLRPPAVAEKVKVKPRGGTKPNTCVCGRRTEEDGRPQPCPHLFPHVCRNSLLATQLHFFLFPAYLVRQPESRSDGEPLPSLQKIKAIPELRGTQEKNGSRFRVLLWFFLFFSSKHR